MLLEYLCHVSPTHDPCTYTRAVCAYVSVGWRDWGHRLGSSAGGNLSFRSPERELLGSPRGSSCQWTRGWWRTAISRRRRFPVGSGVRVLLCKVSWSGGGGFVGDPSSFCLRCAAISFQFKRLHVLPWSSVWDSESCAVIPPRLYDIPPLLISQPPGISSWLTSLHLCVLCCLTHLLRLQNS